MTLVTDYNGTAQQFLHTIANVLGKGLSFLGAVGGTKAESIVEFARPSDVMAYTNLDNVGPTPLTITAASNTNPIVLTSTSHGLVDGDVVSNSSIGGNTNANGNYYVKNLTANTYALYTDKLLTVGRAGNAAYTSGGTSTKLLRFANVARLVGGSGYVVRATIRTNVKTCVASFKLHLYASPVTVVQDNIAQAKLWANRSPKIGEIIFPAMTTDDPTTSDSAESFVNMSVTNSNIALAYKCAVSDSDLYGTLEILTGAFTPTSGQLFNIKLLTEQD